MIHWRSMHTPTDNVVRNGQRFTRHHVKQNAQGTYFCKASSSKGKITIHLGRLFISPAPKGEQLIQSQCACARTRACDSIAYIKRNYRCVCI